MRTNFLVMVVSATAIMTACVTKTSAPKEQSKIVKTAVAEAYGQDNTITLPAKVRAAEDVQVAFKVSGSLLNIPVKVGQRVNAGEVIAQMDPRDYQIQFSATEAEYKQVKGEAERVIELYKKNSVSKSDYEKAYYGLQQITAKYNAHKNALNDTKLRAPFAGIVQKINYSKGETVGAGYPVIALISTSAPEVEVGLPASEYMQRANFISYECRQELFPDTVFPMELTGISQKANLNQLYTARFRFAGNPKELPSAGLVASITIHYRDGKNSKHTVVPLSAVCGRENEATVWVLDAETGRVGARKVEVLQITSEGNAVIGSGLSAGETVVSAGVNSLHEGQTVSPVAPKTATNKGGLL